MTVNDGGARAEILARIRTALSDRPADAEPIRIPRDYRSAASVAGGSADELDLAGLVRLFADRLSDYQATVSITDAEQAATALGAALARRGARRVVVPTGFPAELLAGADATLVADDPPLPVAELDTLDGVLTTCALAIAETGTIVLDASDGQGRRALTLVPDYHLVVVRADQIVATVPDAVARLDPNRPLTWISGPSATSDIELSRVEGVHGPRTLQVVITN